MNKQVRPITPEEALKQQLNSIPDFVIEAVNGLIVKEFEQIGESAVVRQDDIIHAIQEIEPVESSVIFKNKWLDFEKIYEEAGWNVDYDSPGYNEHYPAIFVFTKKQ